MAGDFPGPAIRCTELLEVPFHETIAATHRLEVITMTSYETTATVESQGQILVLGLPFQAGTKVDVTITPARNGAESPGRAVRLLAALDKARNSESVGPLRRADLYDRDILH